MSVLRGRSQSLPHSESPRSRRQRSSTTGGWLARACRYKFLGLTSLCIGTCRDDNMMESKWMPFMSFKWWLMSGSSVSNAFTRNILDKSPRRPVGNLTLIVNLTSFTFGTCSGV